MKIFLLIFISYISIFNFYCSKCNNCCEKCCTHWNKIIKKSHDTSNKNNKEPKDYKHIDEHKDNNIVHYKDFNKDFKFTFLKNALFQHNNNCTLNAVFMSLFNFPQIQNLLLYNDFNNEILKCAKNLLQKAINENDNNKHIEYSDIYNNIINFIKNNRHEMFGEIFSDSIKPYPFIKLFENSDILIFSILNNFICYELTKQYFISKDNLVKIINNGSNNPDFKNILKNNDIVKKIYKELKYYNKICEIIDNLNFNRNNTGSYENDENIIDLEYDDGITIEFTTGNDENANLFLDLKNIIIIPENENVKEYIKNLQKKIIKNKKEKNLIHFFPFNFFYDKILEDNKIELELISINFIVSDHHVFTINKNVKDNKWYMFDDLYQQNCIEVDFEQLLKDGFFIKKCKHTYKPYFFYFNAKFKNK